MSYYYLKEHITLMCYYYLSEHHYYYLSESIKLLSI
jgi:hypothetical protein